MRIYVDFSAWANESSIRKVRPKQNDDFNLRESGKSVDEIGENDLNMIKMLDISFITC